MLVYVGKNGEYLIGVPARDLTDEEVDKLGGKDWLLESGLYALPSKPAAHDIKPKAEKEK